jgi:hypothetical protein
MPKKEMDYSKCVIYKITCNDESVLECYVGHTTNFVKRKYTHKNTCNNLNANRYNVKLYQMIREHGGWDNWAMIPICEYPCENHIQACIKEEEYRVELQAKLNSQRAFLSKEEKQKRDKMYNDNVYQDEEKGKIKKETSLNWKNNNKEKCKEYWKIYYEKNKERLKDKSKLQTQQKNTFEIKI